MPTFRQELENLINRESMENGSDTPDFVLAQFLAASLEAFDAAVNTREGWYGRQPRDRKSPHPTGAAINADDPAGPSA